MSAPATIKKLRADQLLVERGLAPSRSRAADMVRRGCVAVAGITVTKPGQTFASDCAVTIDDVASQYVSRAALKLNGALETTDWNVEGARALDLGASTGGFTQVLLKRGARQVVALDVGHGQLATSIRENARVTVLEHFNARDLTANDLPFTPDFIVSDMSFISLRIAAEPALRLAEPSAHCILLVKPQFEVGRDGIGKGGLVRDAALIPPMLESMRDWLNGLPGWQVDHLLSSSIRGSDGNQEYLLCGSRHG